MSVLLLGWTPKQLALAKARHARLTKTELPATLDGAVALQAWWDTQNYPPPGDVVFVGTPPAEADHRWAIDVIKSIPR